jgi:hypothetical protein
MPVVSCAYCANIVTLPENWASPGFLCPHCRGANALNAPVSLPEPLPLSEEEAFDAPRPVHSPAALRREPTDALSTGGKVLIVLGYAAFVAIPVAAVIAVAVYRLGGPDRQPDAPEVAQNLTRERPEPGQKPVTPRPPKPANDDAESGTTIPAPRAVEGSGKPEEALAVAVAPEPRDAPTESVIVPAPELIAIAPEPHVARPVVAIPAGYTSRWEKVGAVEARVAGVAVTRVPITDVDGIEKESPVAVLAVWVEVRTQNNPRPPELRRWQDSLGQYCELTTARGGKLGRGLLGPGATLRTGLPYKQPLPADGTPRIDVLVFASPPDEAGELQLTLDAERVGETGKFKLAIPASAWKK